MIYAYLRVSTDKQDGENQKKGIDEFCKKKAEGVQLGRIKGSHNSYTKLSDKKTYIINELNNKRNKTSLAKELKVDRTTLYRHLREWGEI